MSTYFAAMENFDFFPNPDDDVMDTLFQQYKRVIVESLITTFGLDSFIKDQHGGDVDTINNVRQIGDGKMEYKNISHKAAYENRGKYDSHDYHSDKRYIEKNREISNQKAEGTLIDAYTHERIARNEKSDLDHVIPAKEIHEDRGRVLSGLKGTDLANSDENLCATNPHTNRTKKASPMDDYLEKYGDEYTDSQKENMHKIDANARKHYEAKIAVSYYTSPGFAADTIKAAGKVGIQMGIRQVVGLIFTEIWFSVEKEFSHISMPFKMDEFLIAVGNGVKQGFDNAKNKYKELLNKFKEGAISGVLSNITTTLCNIFLTTAKNIVKIIRQSYVCLVQAAKILFLNPENLSFGERMRATLKIIATGASVVLGTVVLEAISDTGIKNIPILCDIVPAFCGSLVTGILTCSLLYYLDCSENMNRLIFVLNTLPTISTEVDFYKRQALYFENYAAELMQIDLIKFKEEISIYSEVVKSLETTEDEITLNRVLKNALIILGIEIPWGEDFNSLMNDKSKVLIFE